MAKAENCFTIGLSLCESLKRNAQAKAINPITKSFNYI